MDISPSRAVRALRKLSKFTETHKIKTPLPEFHLPGTLNIHDSPDYRNKDFTERFSPSFTKFQTLISTLVEEGTPATFYKYGDGDYYFLKGEENGSAKPGNRALSKPYSQIDLPRFQQGSRKADYYMCEIPDADRERFRSTFPQKTIDFPAEYVYAGVASRWFFQKFDGHITLIGASEKLDLIEELMKHQQYREYLGITESMNLIRIPQKFACDDLDETIGAISQQIEILDSSVFLFGVGHVKSGIIGHLKEMKNAVFIDIGSGIDALAGVIDVRRPYFGKWINFELPNTEAYSNIDWLQVQNRGNQFFLGDKHE